MEKILNYIMEFLPQRFKKYIENIPVQKSEQIKEIRLRIGKPFLIDFGNSYVFAHEEGNITSSDINSVMTLLSDYSMNSIRDKLAKGFITLKYGCRIGIAGEVIIKNGQIEFQRNINSINIRIAHECKGCSQKILSDIYSDAQIHNTLIVSPPMMGKTTLLRDIAINLGRLVNVTIIDERSEIAACHNGIAQFDLGPKSDILDGCPKPEGIAMAVRSMSPRVIITDEIGSISDCNALIDAAKCGVNFVATMHADSIFEAERRKCSEPLFQNGIVKRVILLSNRFGIGTIEEVAKY